MTFIGQTEDQQSKLKEMFPPGKDFVICFLEFALKFEYKMKNIKTYSVFSNIGHVF